MLSDDSFTSIFFYNDLLNNNCNKSLCGGKRSSDQFKIKSRYTHINHYDILLYRFDALFVCMHTRKLTIFYVSILITFKRHNCCLFQDILDSNLNNYSPFAMSLYYPVQALPAQIMIGRIQ